MSLQINVAMTTRSGFDVPAGAYCWIQERRAVDNQYSIEANLVFFKNKASFDAGFSRFIPSEIPDNKMSYRVVFSPVDFGNFTSLQVQTYIRDQLIALLGANSVTLVP
jgi:hypothetical protein